MLILVASKDTGEEIFDVFMFKKKKRYGRGRFICVSISYAALLSLYMY
jgi:predicted RNA-binding protein YlxR (DUF448 family)